MTSQSPTLYYIHDPMCSWCWGFRTTWMLLAQRLKSDEVAIQYVAGGLAPDSDMPMPMDMQSKLQATWARIQEAVSDTEFNFDFWRVCQPRRSTYPACRAVIAARQKGADYEKRMIYAIQQAYYVQAKNPSDDDTLCECAAQIGLDVEQFKSALNSEEIHRQFAKDIELYYHLASKTGVSGFPSLVIEKNISSHSQKEYRGIALDYNDADTMYYDIHDFLNN